MNVMQLDEEAIYHVARGIGRTEATGGLPRGGLRRRYQSCAAGSEALLRVCEQEASFLDPAGTIATVACDRPDRASPGTRSSAPTS